jgi:hypothetical protein
MSLYVIGLRCPDVVDIPMGATCANFFGLFCPLVAGTASLFNSEVCLHESGWIPPRDFERHSLYWNVLFSASEHSQLLIDPFAPVPCRRIVSPGLDLIHRNHQQNFGEAEVADRILRDLEHGLFHTAGIAGLLPI